MDDVGPKGLHTAQHNVILEKVALFITFTLKNLH
jgi:hypothetical protein